SWRSRSCRCRPASCSTSWQWRRRRAISPGSGQGSASPPAPSCRRRRRASRATSNRRLTRRTEPMLVDSHCHLDFPDFADELDAVVARARAAGIGRIVTISTRVARHDGLIAIAERFPDVFCSVGTHPHNAHEELDVTAVDLVARARHPKVVAIGEAGLDYHYDFSPRDAQERGFRTHIAAARETRLPLLIPAPQAA